jgi:hypothetical protein
MPPWYVNVIGVTSLLLLIVVLIFFTQKRLLSLWKEVSSTEIKFYRQLEKTMKVLLLTKQQYKTSENEGYYKTLSRYKSKRVRSLLLQSRRELFNIIQVLHTELNEQSNSDILAFNKEYEALQKARRIYNSRVLSYNQTINLFPTKYLAIKMNLKTKEYFG